MSSISYVATRMSGNLSDTMQEHSIASILTVSQAPVCPLQRAITEGLAVHNEHHHSCRCACERTMGFQHT